MGKKSGTTSVQKTAAKTDIKKKLIQKEPIEKAVTVAVTSRKEKTVHTYGNQKDHFLDDAAYANMGLATRAIHAGNQPDPINGGVCPSIDLSTTYRQPTPGETCGSFDYTRCGNPTVMRLQRNVAALEGGKYAFATSSGMAATVSILSLLEKGDHFITIDDVYGGTQRYINKIFGPQTGITFDMIDFTDLKKVKAAIKKNTKLMWIESPTNPTLKCTDIAAVAKICKEKGVRLVIDNTFMSPALQNPLSLGADVVMHSITKYIGGHSDVVAGCLVFNDSELYDKLYFNIKSMGTMIAPFDAWVALRGSKTLKLRAEKAMENGMAIAKHLEAHPKIEKVLYPGLPSHPHHEIALLNRANDKLSGGSGMVGVYIKGDINKANTFLQSLHLFTLAESLGGVESLIESPALMTHGSVPQETRVKLGIDDNYCRVSVGIEDIEDLIADLDQALEKI